MKRICKQCGKEFELSDSEIQFYKSKNLNIPKRCKECRDRNKQKQPEATSLTEEEKQTAIAEEPRPAASNRQSRKPLAYMIAVFFVIAVAIGSRLGNADQPAANGNYSDRAADGLSFRSDELREEHYQKHGIEMGFSSALEYEAAAVSVVENADALHKTEEEDGDDVYYLERTNEFVIVSTDGFIRTYFNPDDGIDYYNRQ